MANEEKVNHLTMSDEDMADLPMPELEEINEGESNETNDTHESNEPIEGDITAAAESDESNDDGSLESGSERETSDTRNEDGNADERDGQRTDKFNDLDSTEEVPETEAKEAAEETKIEEAGDTKGIDYKAEYERIMAPFRANNKDMQVSSTEEALTLMKMGANYNKKMAGLKPNLKLMKMLANNDLLDESKLAYLIDLDKKKPEAISKLINESGIDPLDARIDDATEYKPSTYTVNDKEVELDTVLDDIRETDSYTKTIEIIGNKWDESSRQVLLEQPNVIRLINEQVANGMYAQISEVVEHQKMLGNLAGLSDIQAYKQVGDAMQANGKFNNVAQATQKITPAATQPIENKPVSNPKLRDRKRAASSTKSAPSSSKVADFNPLAVSDDEFEKLAGSKFI